MGAFGRAVITNGYNTGIFSQNRAYMRFNAVRALRKVSSQVHEYMVEGWSHFVY
jgi:hypothetical protein